MLCLFQIYTVIERLYLTFTAKYVIMIRIETQSVSISRFGGVAIIIDNKRGIAMHILIAEDSKSSRDVIKVLIQKQISSEIFESANGVEALEIIKSKQIDILISDIKMPMMDGLELIEQAYAVQPDLQMMFGGTNDKKTQKKKTVRERKHGQRKKEDQSQGADFEMKL